jgi:RNA polymerase sigma factor (sigma-70 family)
MTNGSCALALQSERQHERALQENIVTRQFLENPNEHSFAALFNIFSPQLLSFFRHRTPEFGLAEDLTQEVMLTVYQKYGQVRDRKLFRAWVFKIAHNTLYQHCGKRARAAGTLNIDELENRVSGANSRGAEIPSFEFRHWMTVLSPQEQDVMTLRFVEEWEYHEIAAARGTPIGTVKWKVSDCKRKLAKHLGYRARTAAQAGTLSRLS